MRTKKPTDSDMQIQVGSCISALEGYAFVQGVHPFYFESWQRLAQDRSVGDLEHTLISYQQVCDFDFKAKVKVGVVVLRLCDLASDKSKERVFRVLADPKVRKRFDALSLREPLGVSHNFTADLTAQAAAEARLAVNAFSDRHPDGFIFDDFREALPELCGRFLFDIPPAPTAGLTRIGVQLFNRSFRLDDCRRRIFSEARCS